MNTTYYLSKSTASVQSTLHTEQIDLLFTRGNKWRFICDEIRVETKFAIYTALIVVRADMNQLGACKRYNLRFR